MLMDRKGVRSMSTILRVSDLNKTFEKKVAIEDVNFHINSGEAYGLLGPNGAGKSTTIHIISGILAADQGEVLIGDYSIKSNRKKAQSLIGVVPQEIALYPTMSAEANLLFFGKLYGLKGTHLQKAVEENLKLVGLYERRKEVIEKYSGGMKRRINIAAALLHQPKLIIMDEPTVGIDPQSRSHILQMVKALQKDKGISILYTSHYMEEVEAICDRVGIIDNGKLIIEGSISELKKANGDKSQLVISAKDPNKIKSKLELIKNQLDLPIEEYKNKIHIFTNSPNEILPKVMSIFEKLDCEVRSIDILEPNLETIFLSLTGRNLRDE